VSTKKSEEALSREGKALRSYRELGGLSLFSVREGEEEKKACELAEGKEKKSKTPFPAGGGRRTRKINVKQSGGGRWCPFPYCCVRKEKED